MQLTFFIQLEVSDWCQDDPDDDQQGHFLLFNATERALLWYFELHRKKIYEEPL